MAQQPQQIVKPISVYPAQEGDEPLEDYIKQLSPRKQAFIEVLCMTFGNISQTCNALQMGKAGHGRATYYTWMREDKLFRDIVESLDFKAMKVDMAESSLMANVAAQKEISVLYILNNLGQERGYNVPEGSTKKAKEGDAKQLPSWFSPTTDMPEDLSSFEPVEIVSSTIHEQKQIENKP